MNITNRPRFRRSLALALTFIVSSCTELMPFSGEQVFAAPNDQRESASIKSYRSPQPNEDLEDSLSATVPYESAEGPIVRIALMTDVTSISISSSTSSSTSSSSGLIIDHANEGFRSQKLSLSSLRIELRKQGRSSAPAPSTAARYSVFVGSSSDARNAQKLEDRLKREFFEPISTTLDEKKKQYVVTIGHFTTRDSAEAMVRVLQNAGYKAPNVVTDPKPASARDLAEGELVTDTNARAAKRKAEPVSAASRGKAQIVAIAADKVVASSDAELIVAASERENDLRDATPSLRVGNKYYRGAIHFIANPRGKLNVVNALPLEQYLRGVVPMEISASAHAQFEAIKAQAVASRSFALAGLGQHRDEGYDLVDDSRSQVYGGLSAERELTNRAIEMTRGMVASYINDNGKLQPIEAMFTANCGGRTENNDEVFGGKPRPYLRSVVCVTDRQSLAGRDIITTRTVEPLNGGEGRSVSREVALLSVLGFSLPRRASNHYLRGSLDQDEARNWTEQLARLAERDKPTSSRADASRLAEFARLVVASVYGEVSAKLMSLTDVDYLLAGIRVEQLSREGRTDVATLLKDGIFRLPDDGAIDGRATVTRAQAVEMIGRAILLRSGSSLKPQISSLKFQIRGLRSGTAAAAEKGRLVVSKPASTLNAANVSKAPGFVSVNASAPGKLASSSTKTARAATSSPAKSPLPAKDDTRRAAQPDNQLASQTASQIGNLDIAEGVWLFRALAGESYPVDRLTLIGGERVVYHLNAGGRVDFLEASISERGASIDGSANVAPWQQRVTLEELQQRLTRAHINVGRPEHIEPAVFSASTRITEVDLLGSDGKAHLRIPQIRNGLGLKEHLFSIERETDTRGHLVAFVFTGRGSGHGVGMCQAGAYRMADEGYSYTAILQKYYTGIEVRKTY